MLLLSYLGFVPVEAVVFVVVHSGPVAPVLRQVPPFVDHLVGLKTVARHPLRDLTHGRR